VPERGTPTINGIGGYRFAIMQQNMAAYEQISKYVGVFGDTLKAKWANYHFRKDEQEEGLLM